MTASEFLSYLRKKGIRLWAEGNKLRYSAPKGALTADIRAELAERKAEVLSFLGETTTIAALDLSSIRAISQDGELPLSFAEQGLWLLDQLSPGMTAYNMQSRLRLRGPLNVAALERSLNTVIQRHDILRSTFRAVKEQPARVVAPTLIVNLPVINLDRPGEADAEIGRIASEAARLPFDLFKGPLLRVSLLQLSEREHIFLLTKHHIITDAWSNRVFFRELLSLYEGYSAGRPSSLSDLPMQYSDFAVWQRQLNQGQMQSHLAYWKTQLQESTVPEMPFDYPRRAVQSFRGARQEIQLSKSLSNALKALSQQERTTLFITLLAAFKTLLHRYTGETDIVVGSTIAGRNRPEVEKLIGFFINLLVLRSNLSGQPSFRDLLKRVREVCWEAYEHQDLPFEKLVEELKPRRDLSRNPFFQVLFNMANLPPIQREVAGLTIETFSRPEDAARFDLTLYAPETKEGIKILAAYSTDLFTQARIAEMLEQYRHLLTQVVENPDERIDRYSLVTPSARAVLPNPTLPLNDTWEGAVHTLFSENARRSPDQLAVVDPQEAWSYLELDLRSNQLAWYLLAHGIGREDIVAIYGHRSAPLVAAVLGILKAGAAFLILDPAYPAARLLDYLQTAPPRGWLQMEAAGAVPEALEEFITNSSLPCRLQLPQESAAVERFLSQYSADDPRVTVEAEDIACIAFTSGSTGQPKGILGRHGPLSHFLPWQEETFNLGAGDRFSMLSGLSHDPLQREIFSPLWLGATLCIPDPQIIGTSKLADWMDAQRITFAHLTPAMAQLLTETAGPDLGLPALRYAFFVGDKLARRDVIRLRRVAPNVTCITSYGTTETQRAVGFYKVPPESELEDNGDKAIYPLGRGMEGVQLLVLTDEQRLAGIGELGEIYVRSPHLAKGYLGDEALTQARFVTNPFTRVEGDRLYRTGDLGRYLPEGNVQFDRRGDNQVKIRGFRIELEEIEAMLGRHPALRESVVAARPDASGNNRLVAYVVPFRDAAPAIHELRNFLLQKLPDYMVPASFFFLKALPLTPNGKLDREALPAPDQNRPELESEFAAPRNATEKTLADIWAEVLKLDRVGIHDNFFELGGHSLTVTRVIYRAREALRIELPVRHLFENPTVAGSAARIAEIRAQNILPEKMAAVLAALESLSDEEAERLLARESSTED